MDVRFDAASLTYPSGYRALDAVSFTVPTGQFCVLLGRSGSGKSSLLRVVNGLVAPTAGSVSVGGFTASGRGLTLLRPRIAMVHQDFALVGRATVAHNIVSGAAAEMPLWRLLLGIASPSDRARACATARDVGLAPAMMRQRVDRLSGGQQQRVGLARAMMLRPAVVLADEPVSNLDPQTARDILALLKAQACASGATVICSLHQPDLARQFGDRIIGLDAGRVAFDSLPDRFDAKAADLLYRDATPRLLAVA